VSRAKKTVEDVVHVLGVTSRTLHYYEEVGLIPAPERTGGGHRLYDDETIDKIAHILRLKEHLGYSLQEIRGTLEAEDDLEHLKVSYHSSADQAEREVILTQCAEVLGGIVHAIEEKMMRLQLMHKTFQDRLDRVAILRSAKQDTPAD